MLLICEMMQNNEILNIIFGHILCIPYRLMALYVQISPVWHETIMILYVCCFK